ncbi:MAG: 7-cyano-7-deazaguanine synthase QueC [Alphaproteobacteria bacterium]
MSASQKALVLYSGGQDSTVALAWALSRFAAVETVGFDYRQRHRVELEARRRVLERIVDLNTDWRARLGPDHTFDLAVLSEVSASALTRDVPIETGAGGLPTSFVPGRNLIFFTFAAAIAYARGAKHLVGGMCETDFSGYPDCRDDTLKALQVALGLGMDTRFVIETPLMWLDKRATWALAHELGGQPLVDLIVEETHTCYQGDRTHRHAWGYGCGTCPACQLRSKGYLAWVGQSSVG